MSYLYHDLSNVEVEELGGREPGPEDLGLLTTEHLADNLDGAQVAQALGA